MFNWKRIQQLLGETMREIGILVFVFAPLEATFADRSVEIYAIVRAMLMACALIGIGIIAETKE